MIPLDLETLSPEEAEKLLRDICPRIDKHAPRLAQLCGYLSLALRVSAGLLANDDTRSVENYLHQLTDQRLKGLRDPDDPTLDVEASLKLSYAALDTVSQQALRYLAGISATFDLAEAEAVFQPKGDMTVEELLGTLRRRCLIDWNPTTKQYGLHDLVRAFAARPAPTQEIDPRPEQYSESEEQQQELLRIYRRTLTHLLNQAADYGGEAFAPPQTVNAIADARENIRIIKEQLRKKDVQVEHFFTDYKPKPKRERWQTITRYIANWRHTRKARRDRVANIPRLVLELAKEGEAKFIIKDEEVLTQQKMLLETQRRRLSQLLILLGKGIHNGSAYNFPADLLTGIEETRANNPAYQGNSARYGDRGKRLPR